MICTVRGTTIACSKNSSGIRDKGVIRQSYRGSAPMDTVRPYGDRQQPFPMYSAMLTNMHAGSSSGFLWLSVFAVSLCGVAYGQPAPCDLLTQKQVSTVLGVSVGEGSPIANTGCSWKATGASKVVVTVSMQTEKMFDGAKRSAASMTTNKPISGIGDEAVFTGVPNFSSLWVRKGARFPLVRIYGLPVSEAETKLKALAADVVSKL